MNKFTAVALTALTLGILATSTANAQWATLKGQFLYGTDGTKVPTEIKLTPTKDVEVCGKHQLYDEALVINKENRGVANVVLWAFKPKGKVQTARLTVTHVPASNSSTLCDVRIWMRRIFRMISRGIITGSNDE